VTILHGGSEISDVAQFFDPNAHPTYNKAWQFGLLLTAFCKFYPDVIAGRNAGAARSAAMAPPPVTDTQIVDFASCCCAPSLALFSYDLCSIKNRVPQWHPVISCRCGTGNLPEGNMPRR
jgi:hypothetical protein